MEITGAELILALLKEQGIDTVTGIPGGSILPFYDALSKSGIRHILARHEQGAGFIAQGMARSTGKPAVCLATSGPGATNLVTAIADAKQDSVPLVAITGQVPTPFVGTDAFQEVDIYHMTVPITKHNFSVRSANELSSVIPAAFEIALSGRPGPVLIDIPKDIFLQKVTAPEPFIPSRKTVPAPDSGLLSRAADMISKASRPVIYAGGGIITGRASEQLIAFAHKNSIPVATTLMGLGSFPSGDPLHLGMIGMHGASGANILLDEADLLLALGVRFGDRTVGKMDQFCPNAEVIHIDIDASELGKIRGGTLPIRGDLAETLAALTAMISTSSRESWLSRVSKSKPAAQQLCETPSSHPEDVLRRLRPMLGSAIVTTDVGQHQMWSAQILGARGPRKFLTSGGLGTMGFGLPAAIGAAVANEGTKVVCITGDGSIQMNIQELATLAELDVDVAIILLNNGHLGLVRQQQEFFFGNRVFAAKFTNSIDFTAIARGFGLEAHRAQKAEEIPALLARAMTHRGPFLAEIIVDETANVFPMVPPGNANREMIGG
jgi:acetolactate synthase-1/2/3 large subunit